MRRRGRSTDRRAAALRRAPVVAALAGTLLLLGLAGPAPRLPLAASTQASASCDTDGVSVSYGVQYRAAPPAGYTVTTVVVGGIAAACTGGQLSVTLTQDGSPIGAGGPVNVTGATVPVPIGSPPLARLVNDVHVEIAVGGPAAPAECSGMSFDATITGTAKSDVLQGTNARDLILAQGGNDTAAALSGADCVDGGAGNDLLQGGSGDDRLVGGAGNDQIDGAAGADRLFGGNGNDALLGGPGDDLIDGGPGNDACIGGPGNDAFVNCEAVTQ